MTGRSGLPVPVATPAPELAPFHAAAAQDRLVVPHCRDCGFAIWYPRAFCPVCDGDVDWRESPGLGTVYSYTITRHGPGKYRETGPYVLAYVELAEGPRVLTNIVQCDPADVRIGRRVTAVFDHDGDEHLLRFRLLPDPDPKG
jgi:hypothetical protein